MRRDASGPVGAGAAWPRPVPAPPRSARRTGATSILRATKAETLDALRGRLPDGSVPPLVHFSVVEWRRRPAAVLHDIRAHLAAERLAVRSSARDEDQAAGSRAGHYRSRLDVPRDARSLTLAIDEVVASFDGHPSDRVLVQEMVRDVAASGVLVTRDPASGGPYYVFEYDDAGPRTDAVTSGSGIPKRVVAHRSLQPRQLPAPRLRRLIAVARRIERLARCAGVEIELAESRAGRISVLQVRALGASARPGEHTDRRVDEILGDVAGALAERSRRHAHLAGSSTILGQMPDWNPAELIGTLPGALAASLFQLLIGDDVWQQARASMGYRALPGASLVSTLAGRPWVDVRLSFNSFLPADLDPGTQHALVDAWLARLGEHPELHDKVEFEVAQTVLDFAFGATHRARYGATLSPRARDAYVAALRTLTVRNVSLTAHASLPRALAAVERLGRRAIQVPGRATSALAQAFRLLDSCRRLGTLPFAIVARHAFIAEALLRSAVARGALAPERHAALRRSCDTVAGALARDFVAASIGRLPRARFLERYGHLRPGSFDMTSPRYDQRAALFDDDRVDRRLLAEPPPPFVLAGGEARALDALCTASGLRLDGAGLLAYARRAIAAREHAKLLFTRHLSAALEHLAAWGARHEIGREELAHATLADLRAAADPFRPGAARSLRDTIAARCTRREDERVVRLGVLLRDSRDLYLPCDQAMPTFVTGCAVSGEPLLLDDRRSGGPGIAQRIVCIASADPGFDWIFAYRIAGLITCFGGGNSHMAIRCFELGIPAAIGVGEAAFSRICSASRVELRCRDRVLRCLDPAASV